MEGVRVSILEAIKHEVIIENNILMQTDFTFKNERKLLDIYGEKNLEITGVNAMNNRMNTRQRDSMICTIVNVDNGLNSRSKVPISRGDDSTDDSDQVNSLTEYVNIHK